MNENTSKPWLKILAVVIVLFVVGYLAVNWDDFKAGLLDGYNSAGQNDR